MELSNVVPTLEQAALARDTGAVGSWSLDAERSTIGFSVRKLWGLLKVRGRFTIATGEVTVGGDGAVRATLDIDAASVDTGNAKRDTHVRSKDFFDVDRFPTMVVRIDRVDLTDARTGTARGRLTILGQTRPLELPVTIALGGTAARATVAARTTVDRSAFGMSWGPLGVVSQSIDVTVELAFVRDGA